MPRSLQGAPVPHEKPGPHSDLPPRAGPAGGSHRSTVGAGVVIVLVTVLLASGLPTAGSTPASSPLSAARTPSSALPTVAVEAPAAGVPSAGFAWSLLSATEPGPRSGAGFAALSSAGEGVLFGGATSAGLNGSTVLYNESTDRWTTLAPARFPSARSDFGLATEPATGSALLFGGLLDRASGSVSNETWAFSFATGDWTNLTHGAAPAARADPAFAVGNGTALLFGGVNPNASGSGRLVFADTWTFDLTTDVWTRANPSGPTPGPLSGASLLWDPVAGVFLLFGGCFPCASTVWAFSPTTSSWSALAASGASPGGRMGAVWSWDPLQSVALLFGGTNGTAVLNDTYAFSPATPTWTRVASSAGPSARSGAASDFLAVAGNATLLLAGGTTDTGTAADAWRLAVASSLVARVLDATTGSGIVNATVSANGHPFTTNASGFAVASSLAATETRVVASAPGFASNSTSVWLSPGSSVALTFRLTPLAPATVEVTVTDPSSVPIVDASVSLAVEGHSVAGSPQLTNATGVARFVNVPAANGTVSASETGYWGNATGAQFASATTTRIRIVLASLPELSVRALGRLAGGTVTPLELVPISVASVVVGLTDSLGYLNLTVARYGPVPIAASVYGYTTARENVTLGFTGTTVVNLTLVALAFPEITISVVGRTSPSVQVLVQGARVDLTSTGLLPSGPFRAIRTTDANGSVDLSAPPGNYTLSVSAPGFLTPIPITFFVASAVLLNQTVVLIPEPLATFDVHVRSSADGRSPIPGAVVLVNFTSLNLTDGRHAPASRFVITDPQGWANFSGLPASALLVIASAPGYATNATFTTVAYGQNVSDFELELSPILTAPFTRLSVGPPGAVDIVPFALLPAVGLIGALVYLMLQRTPSTEPDDGQPAVPDRASPSDRLPRPRA